MRIATWNINGLRARLDFLLHWLGERKPDVVGLQELKLADDQFPHAELEAAGYRAVTHGQKSWNGVAVLSREGAQANKMTQTGLPGQEEAGARLLSVEANDLSFTTVYVPNGKTISHADFPLKLAWLDALAEHFEGRHDPAQPTVLCGDFNIVPAALDSWNEEKLTGGIFHTDDERSRFQRLIDWGFKDVFREQRPEATDFSWWDYRAGAFHKGHGLRIDFLLATPSALERVRSVEIDREYRKKKYRGEGKEKTGLIASDHAPVFADLD